MGGRAVIKEKILEKVGEEHGQLLQESHKALQALRILH
jgi:hypothetical protein